MLVHRRVTPSIKFGGIHLYTWVERGTVTVKCLAQEYNTVSPARAPTQTARSGDERTNHEATGAATSRAMKTSFNLSELRLLKVALEATGYPRSLHTCQATVADTSTTIA